jgi:hypothetical protein
MTISDLAGEFDRFMCPYCHGEGCDLCGFSGFAHVKEDDVEGEPKCFWQL